MSETIWQRDDNWVGAENEDSFVMVNIDTGAYATNRLTCIMLENDEFAFL